MFKTEKMYRARVFLPRKNRDEFVQKLHEAGVCQLKQSEADLGKESAGEAQRLLGLETGLNEILQHLDEFKHIRQPENIVKQLFFPPKPREIEKCLLCNTEFLERAEETVQGVRGEFFAQYNRLGELQKGLQKNRLLLENLALLPDVKTELFESSPNLSVSLGLRSKSSLERVRQRLGAIAAFAVRETDEKTVLLGVFASQANADSVAKLLHETGFAEVQVPFGKEKPGKMIAKIKKQSLGLQGKERAIKAGLTKLWEKHFEELSCLQKELGVCLGRVRAIEKLGSSASFVLLEAWVPAKNFGGFKRIALGCSENSYIDIVERDDAPVLLKNPRVVKPFELITNLYGPPKYRRFDPTPIIACSFALFFGFMLTDFFYGLFLAAIALLIFRGVGKYNPELRQFALVLVIAGISTAILGVAFGSYFGNFFQKMGLPMPMLIDPMKQAIVVIAISIAIGAGHMGIGLVFGFVENLKLGKVQDALANQGVWLFFLLGLVSFLLGGFFFFVGAGLVLLALVMQVAFNFKRNGVVVAVLSVFNFSGFIGDLFSYSRLTALAVGTAGIALAVNFMTQLTADMIPVVGGALAVVVFIVGHLFNIVMNGLGAFIHSLRLHFLEFFQKFYAGGGQNYEPFQAAR